MAKLHGISEACKDEHRKADVVFIHGLGGDAFGTWRHGKGDDTSWPHWLAEAFPDVGVWSLGHAADPSKPLGFLKRLLGKGGRDAGQGMSLPDRAGQILDLMRLHKHFRGERPIVFVCHSLGGLLAKQILRKANDKASITDSESISRRTAGVLFLATPHNGADLATLADNFTAICGPTASLDALRAHDPHLRDLYNWYRNHAPTLAITTETYYEGRDVFGFRIVNETSSQSGVGPDAVMLDEDHLSIAKPRERDAQVCLALEEMLRTVQDHAVARKLVQESQRKLHQPDPVQDAAAIRQQLDEQGRQIELLTAAVANLREQAQGPDADATRKRAYELLQCGDTLPAIALLGEEADAAAGAAAYQRDAAVSLYLQQAALQKLSDLRQAMKILEKALQLAPEGVAVLSETGDLAMKLGQTGHAAIHYERLHAAIESKLEADPKSPVLQRDLTVSHIKLGTVLQVQGDLPGAQRHYAAALDIAECLAAQDPENAEWQRDLSISHERLGDVQQAQDDLPGAQRHYAAALDIAERLAAQDPAKAEWQRDLSVSHNKLGRVQQAQGDLSSAQRHYAAALAIRERLAAQDSANAQWQRDLSISHERLGTVQQAQGDLSGAQRHYEATLAIRERLAAQDPANTEWQRDLSVSHNKLGDLQQAQGDLPGAQRHYVADLIIAESLAAQDPANVQWQRDLAVTRFKLADVCEADGDVLGALAHLQAACSILQALRLRAPDHPQFQKDLAWVEWLIAALEGSAAP